VAPQAAHCAAVPVAGDVELAIDSVDRAITFV
jgi:hypothetical protein